MRNAGLLAMFSKQRISVRQLINDLYSPMHGDVDRLLSTSKKHSTARSRGETEMSSRYASNARPAFTASRIERYILLLFCRFLCVFEATLAGVELNAQIWPLVVFQARTQRAPAPLEVAAGLAYYRSLKSRWLNRASYSGRFRTE
jgi:hypothetical protein